MAPMSYPRGLAVGGDIDDITYPALLEALGNLACGSSGVHVDLSGVRFCDLPGLRAIVRLTGASTPVVLHGVPVPLRTVMAVLGWDRAPGLVIGKRQHRYACPALPPGRPSRRVSRCRCRCPATVPRATLACLGGSLHRHGREA